MEVSFGENGAHFYRRDLRGGKADVRGGEIVQIPFELRKADVTSPRPNPSLPIPMADLLNAKDIKDWLKKLPEWDHDKKHIERTFAPTSTVFSGAAVARSAAIGIAGPCNSNSAPSCGGTKRLSDPYMWRSP